VRVLVLGAGVVGVTSAWYLARAGHQVAVVDRQPAAGLEASFATGGQASPSHSEPWANPGTPRRLFSWPGHGGGSALLRLCRWDPDLLAWSSRLLINSLGTRARTNFDRLLRLAVYSRSCLQALRREVDLEYDQTGIGRLHIYRKSEDFHRAIGVAEVMDRAGLARQVKTPAEAGIIEPALETVLPHLAGAIFAPHDDSGDACKFAQRLAAQCAARGVDFHYATRILGLELEAGRLVSVATDNGRLRADAFVLALGSWAPLLARQVGVRLPIYPVKGYSLTLPLDETARAPRVGVADDENLTVYSRLGDRLRCAGLIEWSGWNAGPTYRGIQTLVTRSRALFPNAGDYGRADAWAGLRAMTPDSAPIVGRSPLPDLFLNVGHGTLGWAMCCGAARALADLISRRPPDLDMVDLALERFTLLGPWPRVARAS
jgi:D-amino-acid dehydrogenase